MHHELFRYLSPGICFVTPIYLVVCWAAFTFQELAPLKEFIFVGGAAAIPAMAMPLGWWLYHCFRGYRALVSTGYEDEPFVQTIREGLNIVFDSKREHYYIDFSCINPKLKWRDFTLETFFTVFHPFKTKNARRKVQRNPNSSLGFTEPVSDLLLFPNSSYDYARSISSVRYGLDSSLFALLLGILIALPTLFLFYNTRGRKLWDLAIPVSLNVSYVLLIASFVFLIVLSVIRRRRTDAEYRSRLTLITIAESEKKVVQVKSIDEDTPKEILEALDALPLHAERYVAFDLDDTLLIGDIGESVFVSLLHKGLISNPGWSEYQRLLISDRQRAYVSIVKAMEGLSPSKIIAATEDLIFAKPKLPSAQGDTVPIPKPNPSMQSLVVSLRLRGFNVFIVTASNQISAEVVAWNLFGVPSSNVLGIRSGAKDGRFRSALSSRVEWPVPFSDGKVDALKSKLGSIHPCVTAGDSLRDLPLLRYTCDHGIVIWVGDSNDAFAKLKTDDLKNFKVFRVPREP